MSDGSKKPGLRDISDLKARLGMLNKNAGKPAEPAANPFAAPPPDTAETAPDGDEPTAQTKLTDEAAAAMLGGATAVVNLNEPPSAPPAPAPPQSSPSPMGGGLDFGDDLFKRKDEPAAPSPPMGAPAAPGGASAFEQAQAAQSAQPESGFANPLHLGGFNTGAAPVDLSADEQAALDAFEGKQQGVKASMALAMTFVAAAVCLLFGFSIGDVRWQRRTVNAQIEASIRTKDAIGPTLVAYERLKAPLNAMYQSPTAISWAALEALPSDLPAVDAARVMATQPPLNKELVSLLSRAVTDYNRLFALVTTHRTVTLGRDKAELEGLEKGTEFFSNRHFAILYEPLPAETPALEYRPPRATIVAVVGKPELNEPKDDNILPIKSRTGKERTVSLRKILIIDKNEMLSTRENAQTLYAKRVDEIGALMKKIGTYEQLLKDTLAREASRTKVFSI